MSHRRRWPPYAAGWARSSSSTTRKNCTSAWILDFPLVTYNEEEKRWDAEHHPFCYPVKEDVALLRIRSRPRSAQSYDLVVNGYEAASGSVRIHDAATQQKVFGLLGIAPEEAERRFGFLLEALRYGAPPHAGIALGLDRWVMLFCGNENIREVIAFPKTQKAADLFSGSPLARRRQAAPRPAIRVDLPSERLPTDVRPISFGKGGNNSRSDPAHLLPVPSRSTMVGLRLASRALSHPTKWTFSRTVRCTAGRAAWPRCR